ncbi:MAG: molybdate ABC transporter substrate-binding protein [Clostridiales Family XIII bacterium]|jgi:molybdate transport system substrate-binding protein|nr:molybdate ABC transporter substrate-binding protein [Clostridiales Family XIII bacterium]
MKKMKWLTLVLVAAMAVLVFAGCGGKESGGSSADTGGSSAVAEEPAEEVEVVEEEVVEEPAEEVSAVSGNIMIAAAASLENAFVEELIPLFNETYPAVFVTGTYDSSGKLQTQIEEGLEADLFFSAALKQMDALSDEGLIDTATRTDLLLNEVVLITGTQTETAVTGFENITDAATIAIGDPESVPAGQYAQEVLTSLGIWDAVSAKASLGTNVTEVLTWVAEGSAEVGVVYATDAASEPDKVKVLATAPEGSLVTPVVYPVAMLTRVADDQKEAAQAFLDFLTGTEALAVFESYGFKPYL